MNSQQPKVLIVGAGPTGLTAALELSRLQIPIRIIEKMPEPATTSRTVGVQARTLELLEQRGLVERMLAKGNRGLAGSIYGEGKRVFRLDFSHNGSHYGYMLFISQVETEATLRAALENQQVTIEREVEFVALSQSEHRDSVKAILKHRDGSLITDSETWQHREIADQTKNVEELYGRHERTARLRRAICRLQPLLRNVVEIHQSNDKSVKEIADLAGLSVAATKSRLLRARRALRKDLLERREKQWLVVQEKYG
jgi:DNA-directed RNA polymerase specialized sigma24 family protein